SDSQDVKLHQLASPDRAGPTEGHECGWSSPPSGTAVSCALRRRFGLDLRMQQASSVPAETEIPSSAGNERNPACRGSSQTPDDPVAAGPTCHSGPLEDIPQATIPYSGLPPSSLSE